MAVALGKTKGKHAKLLVELSSTLDLVQQTTLSITRFWTHKG